MSTMYLGKRKYDYSKLKGKIERTLGSQKALAAAIGVSEQSIVNKLKGYTYFNAPEIDAIADVLNISSDEYGVYFFATIVA